MKVPEKSDLPQEVVEKDRWVIWTLEEKEVEEKLAKVPKTPWKYGGKYKYPGDPLDPENWTDFKTARKYAKERVGYGVEFIFVEEDDIAGVDYDDCITDGKVSKEVTELIREGGTYAEVSPSGKGVHQIGFGKLSEQIRNSDKGVEAYDKERPLTFTGRKLKGVSGELKDFQSTLHKLQAKYGETPKGGERKTSKEFTAMDVLEAYFPDHELKEYENYWQGPHPVHGSGTGRNFVIYKDGLAVCFRHELKMDEWDLVGVLEGIIDCDEGVSGPRCLKGDNWIRAVEAAQRKGLVSSEKAQNLASGTSLEVRNTIHLGDRETEIAFEDLYRKNGETRGTFYAKIGEEEFFEENWKLSNRQLKSFVSRLGLGDKDEETLFKAMGELRKEARNVAKSEEGATSSEEEEDLFREEDIPDEDLEMAEQIIEEGVTLPEILSVFEIAHIGDHERKILTWCSFLSKRLTGKGLHDEATGSSGKGKSNLHRYMVEGVPNQYKLVRDSVSPKYLQYLTRDLGSDCLKDKVILYDDITLDEEKEATLKALTDPGPSDEVTHGTVEEQKRLELKIEGKPVVLVNSIEPFNSDQLKNRFFIDEPDESAEMDRKVAQYQKKWLKRGVLEPGKLAKFNTAKAVFQRLWKSEIREKRVVIPFDYEWNLEGDRRFQKLFGGLLQTIVKINHARRLVHEGYVFASLEDFYITRFVVDKFIRTTTEKLTKKKVRILNAVSEDEDGKKTRAEIAETAEVSTGAVRYHMGESSKYHQGLIDLGFVNQKKEDGKWWYWKTKKQVASTCATITQPSLTVDGLKKEFERTLEGCAKNGNDGVLAHTNAEEGSPEGHSHMALGHKTIELEELFEAYKKCMREFPIIEKIAQVIGKGRNWFDELLDGGKGCAFPTQVDTPTKNVKEELRNLLQEEAQEIEELPSHFDKEDLVSVNNILLKWKEDGRAYIDDQNQWRLNE